MNPLSGAEGFALMAATSLYLVAMLMLWLQLFFRADESTPEDKAWHRKAVRSSHLLLTIGAVLHLIALVGEGAPLFTVQAGVASLFGWMLVVAYLVVARRGNLSNLGVFVTPIALLAALYSLTAPSLHASMDRPENLEAPWLVIHVVLILCGYASLAFAFAFSLLYLIQETLLKRKQLRGLWQRLPSLQVADDLIFRATRFGLALMATGIFPGIVWSERNRLGYSPMHDPKVLFSIAIGATFAVYLTSRAWWGWSGRRSNLVVVYGFVLMAISFFGVPHLVPYP